MWRLLPGNCFQSATVLLYLKKLSLSCCTHHTTTTIHHTLGSWDTCMPQKEQPFELKPAHQIIGLLYVQESNFIIILCLLLTDLKGSSKDKHTLKQQFPYPLTFLSTCLRTNSKNKTPRDLRLTDKLITLSASRLFECHFLSTACWQPLVSASRPWEGRGNWDQTETELFSFCFITFF